jgi:hypothetical protein
MRIVGMLDSIVAICSRPIYGFYHAIEPLSTLQSGFRGIRVGIKGIKQEAKKPGEDRSGKAVNVRRIHEKAQKDGRP